MDYLDIGYNPFFQRKRQKTVQPNDLPDLTSYDIDSITQNISGSKITEGVITSKSGKLKIDLDNDQITYNDGVVDLLSLGGQDNGVTIKDQNDQTLLTSS